MLPLVACLLLALSPAWVHAASRANAGYYSTTVGTFDITILSDGARGQGKAMDIVPTVPEAAVVKASSLYFEDPDNLVRHYNPVYVDTGEHKIIFDTGSGGTLGRSLGKLLDNMRDAGIDREKVDTVILSHAHIDHVGGMLDDDGVLVFPNAEYFMSEKEFVFWNESMTETSDVRQLGLDVLRLSFNAVEGKLDFFDFGDEVVPGVTSVGMPGHTPGHSGFLLRSANETFFIGSDLVVVDFINVDHPEWKMEFDVDEDEAVDTRFSMLDFLAKNGTRTAFYHVNFPGIGHIYSDGNGFGFRESKYEL